MKYYNLKDEVYLNTLSDEDRDHLWLPLVVYENTDEKEATGLVEFGNGEWRTYVTITKEGNFTRSAEDEVDETEIFEGAENNLTMFQTYTKEFQCVYHLEKYPFDTQRCSINMVVESLKISTVKLLPGDRVERLLQILTLNEQ